jgi:NAD(P)-dependent dehydrogenase (short-subunit alcohol dehydrogenase family)
VKKTPLAGKVALVAGATRGAGRGIAVQLGAAGAIVYVTGRTTQSERSEMKLPETIEETAYLVEEAGVQGIAVLVDHLIPDRVRALVARIKGEQGALHVLVNGIWGATTMEWKQIGLGILFGYWTAHSASRCKHSRYYQPLRHTATHQDTRWFGC